METVSKRGLGKHGRLHMLQVSTFSRQTPHLVMLLSHFSKRRKD